MNKHYTPIPRITHVQVPLSIQEAPALRRCIATRLPEVLRCKLGQTALQLVQKRAHKPDLNNSCIAYSGCHAWLTVA